MKRRSAFGWGELIIGILLIVLGAFTFARPSSALTGIVFVYGILAVITGIADIVFYVKIEQHTGFGPAVSLVTGILSILAGILLLFNPGAGKWAMVILFPLWFITHCISRLTHLPLIPHDSGDRILLFYPDRQYFGAAARFCHDFQSADVLLLSQLYYRRLFDFDRYRSSGTGGEQHWNAQVKRRKTSYGCWLP